MSNESALGEITFPVGGGTSVTSAAPTSLLGAFVDVPEPISSNTVEATFQGPSSQQQIADLINYHKSQRRREMIRNAAIGLRPDLSLAVVGAPLFATATDTSSDVAAGGLQEDQQSHNQQYQQHNVQLSTQQEHQQQPAHQSQSQTETQSQPQEQRQRLSGLEALLSVSAQRRREEELILLGRSDPGGMSHMR